MWAVVVISDSCPTRADSKFYCAVSTFLYVTAAMPRSGSVCVCVCVCGQPTICVSRSVSVAVSTEDTNFRRALSCRYNANNGRSLFSLVAFYCKRRYSRLYNVYIMYKYTMHTSLIKSPLPIDSIRALVLVWRLRGKIIRTALCCVRQLSTMIQIPILLAW